MNEYVDRVGAERLWVAVVGILGLAVVLGALLFPQRVYVDFVWQYYWGPVVADAHSWGCVAWNGGTPTECGPDTTGPTASPGYTFVSYAGYVPTLVLLLIGILFLIRRLEIERYRAGFYALFPFMLFGGALRVVEDANATAYAATGEMAIQLPWSAVLISPFIYVTVFVVAVAALVAAVWLDRRDFVSGYEYPLAGIGTVALTVTVAYLAYVAATEPYASFHPGIAATTLGGASVVTAITWAAIVRFAPDLNRGTEYMGLVVIWAHTVDGVANVIGLEYATYFGWEQNLVPKHPINAAIVDFFGTAWPFLLVKVAAAVFILWIFDETVFDESPRYAILLLITVVAVGLGPGTRDMLRATFGV